PGQPGLGTRRRGAEHHEAPAFRAERRDPPVVDHRTASRDVLARGQAPLLLHLLRHARHTAIAAEAARHRPLDWIALLFRRCVPRSSFGMATDPWVGPFAIRRCAETRRTK